jgi:hypothetical protein
MFDPTSRYYTIETATHVAEDGREVAYKRRRFLPRADELTVVAEITLTQGDRLDLIAARLLGDAEQFWRVCDANAALNPFELAAEPGRVVLVAAPQLPGR